MSQSKGAAALRSSPGDLRVGDAVDTGQHFALQILQAGAAAGGDMGHLIGIAQLHHGGRAVAAADHGGGVRLGPVSYTHLDVYKRQV